MYGVQHLHLQAVVAHGNVAILGLDEVHAYPAWVGGGGLKAEQHLREDNLRRQAAQDLVNKANFDRACGLGVDVAAMLALFAVSFSAIKSCGYGGQAVLDTGGEQFLAIFNEVRIEADLVSQGQRRS